MATSKNLERVCAIVLIVSLLASVGLVYVKANGGESTGQTMGYESRLFDTSRVHTIDIVMDDWDSFIENCESEEYSACAVVIDGESYKNVAIRAKGNTSLSSVRSLGSSRYSFKVEFDHYDDTKTYHGLDKLNLNNLIFDNTICVGMAASMGAFLLSSGTKGKRLALPNAEIMIHQPSAGTQGQITDMAIHLKRLEVIKKRLNAILADNTGRSVEEITAACERDNFMTAEEAVAYGLIDKVIDKR